MQSDDESVVSNLFPETESDCSLVSPVNKFSDAKSVDFKTNLLSIRYKRESPENDNFELPCPSVPYRKENKGSFQLRMHHLKLEDSAEKPKLASLRARKDPTLYFDWETNEHFTLECYCDDIDGEEYSQKKQVVCRNRTCRSKIEKVNADSQCIIS